MFSKLIEALKTVEPNSVFHYEAFKKSDKYIVWSEDNAPDSVWADGKMQSQTIEGTISYFIKKEDNTAIPRMQKALTDADISFRLNSIQREEDTKFIHYEWVFQI